MDAVRVDRWLCAARVFKSRTQAAQACVGGHVRVNDVHAKTHLPLRVGDRLEVLTSRGPRLLEVVGLAEKRLSPPLARDLYVDHTPAPPPPEERLDDVPRRERGTGRPTKRERRELRSLRGR